MRGTAEVQPGCYPCRRPTTLRGVTDVLIVSDSAHLREEVASALPDGSTVRELTDGEAVRGAVAEQPPDLVVLDLQIGRMGGMATCLDLRLEAGAGRLPNVAVLMLVDRRADVHLARRSFADGWVVKPLDSMRLAKAVRTILDGGTFEDESLRPVTVTLPAPA
ncbi:MAG: response regulator receiver protein [Acidimicrobiales bacterium]|jgi:DNA-binding response OmpR family regulator|nr:response regulator receiver protein [Acidimicrobiales bacterium]